MRIAKLALAASASMLLMAGCASGGLAGRNAPDEYAVARNAPLVVPPDFTLTPPRPGEATPATDSRTQALQALFGGPAPRSRSEQQVLTQIGANPAPGARSVVGDPGTTVVDKGAVTTAIIAAPEGDGQEARASTPR